ncbi:MAG: hypothetical protein U9Q34_03820 [Elusimicrobiota bacterium]|nr:hypothetical protein [Elusimicrobiota bacterium]
MPDLESAKETAITNKYPRGWDKCLVAPVRRSYWRSGNLGE